MDIVRIKERGQALLNNPLYNKGTAFTQEERDAFGLNGLLPPHISSADEQIAKRYRQFSQQMTPIAKHQFLSNLQNSNEVLFYLFISEYLTEMLPLIYTPTVGEASQQFSHLFHSPRGLYLSYPLQDKMEEMINQSPFHDVQVIVVTDGERILGLGDLGIGGMAIPVGKLALYTLFGGIHPAKTLPIVLDVGTNNQELLSDPSYLGWREKRLFGKEYDAFIDRFVHLIKKRYPHVLLQWEDFGKSNASRLLSRYQDTLCSFNDDIQGTAAVTLSAILTAIRVRKSTIKEQRFALLGGGSAGMGICKKLRYALLAEGVDEKTVKELFYVVDIHGLIHTGMKEIDPEHLPFAQPYEKIKEWKVADKNKITLFDVVANAKPTVLIGVSAQGGAFTEEIIKKMASFVDQPAIFPLSNPNSKCEAMPEDLIRWTEGRAIIATGSPFPPISFKGQSYPIAQCNNVYVFPGVGLGVISSKAPKVTDEMFYIASKTLSDHAPILQESKGALFPSFNLLRSISRAIAIEVYKTAVKQELCPKAGLKEIESCVDANMWKMAYPILKPSK